MKIQVYLAVVAVIISSGLGFVVGVASVGFVEPTMQELHETLLNGTSAEASEAIEILLESGEHGEEILLNVFADMPTMPVVPSEHKILVVEALSRDSSVGNRMQSIALGAIRDRDLEVRKACVQMLEDYYQYTWRGAMTMLNNTLDKEQDLELKRRKEKLVADNLSLLSGVEDE